ncbi:MAG: CaiB/BaiF CoA-transferase family protein [Alphaproteobacteria bacterium]
MSSDGPLSGVRVFDLSRILAGPTATQVLGDLGADVIKVERPDQGDDTRGWGPPYVRDGDGRDTTESAYYLVANRNKRSLTLNLAEAEGQALARRLIAGSDVLVENFKVGGLARYGLGYDQLQADFPRLIYCSITGFGQDGPYASRAGYDFLAQGMGGIMSVTGERDGPPMKVGVAIADIMCGMYAVIAVQAALRHRDATGQGQHIDLSLLDTQVAWLMNQASNYLVSGEAPGRLGNEHPNIVPYRVFATADGYIILAVGNDGQFTRFCAAAGLDGLAQDARFASNRARVENRQGLNDAIERRTRQRTTADWLATLEAAGVPCGPVNDMAQVFADPQVRARHMRLDMAHPLAGGGTVPLVASPMHLSRTPVTYRHAPPVLGQHTDEILTQDLGLSGDEIAGLRERGIV